MKTVKVEIDKESFEAMVERICQLEDLCDKQEKEIIYLNLKNKCLIKRIKDGSH